MIKYHALRVEDDLGVDGIPSECDVPTRPASNLGQRQNSLSMCERTAPLINVITVVYNGATKLRSTIESVLHKKQDDLEYIVVDGSSTDGIWDVLKSFNNARDDGVNEAGCGIHDEMNKEINIAGDRFSYSVDLGERFFLISEIFIETVSKNVICITGDTKI